jgi:hypothetical protein
MTMPNRILRIFIYPWSLIVLCMAIISSRQIRRKP